MKKIIPLLFSFIILMMPVVCYANDVVATESDSKDYILEVVDDADIPLASGEIEYSRFYGIPCITVGALLCGIYVLSKRKVEKVKDSEYYEDIVGDKYMKDLI